MLATVLLVLRILADRGELKDPIVTPDPGLPHDDRMWTDTGSRVDLDRAPDHGEGANLDTGVQPGAWVDDCGRMDQAVKSRAVHMISALATIRSSTRASPSNFQIPRRTGPSLTSRIS